MPFPFLHDLQIVLESLLMETLSEPLGLVRWLPAIVLAGFCNEPFMCLSPPQDWGAGF